MKKNILVTGGFGLLGKPLVQKLVQLKYNVIILEKKSTDRVKFLKTKPNKIIAGDFLNKHLVGRVIKKYKINIIFHLGAITQVLESLKDPYKTHEINIMGTINFLENIRKINNRIIFIYSSSDKAYGELNNRIEYKESDRLQSTYPYDVSKSASDLICQSYAKTYSLTTGIVRCGNIYGPGDFNFKRLIPEVILSSIENKRLTIRSSGKSTRDYVYVEDVVEAYISLMKKLIRSQNQIRIYNVSSKFNYSVIQIVNMILKTMNCLHLKPIILNFSKKELKFQRLNYSKIQKELKWKPKTKIQEGIKKTVNWYRRYYTFLKVK